MSSNLEKFGELFINEVQHLNDSQRQLIQKIISQVTDLSLHNMLFMLEEHGEMELFMNGENIAEISDGLSGKLYTEDGWIKKYSEQRVND